MILDPSIYSHAFLILFLMCDYKGPNKLHNRFDNMIHTFDRLIYKEVQNAKIALLQLNGLIILKVWQLHLN